VREIHGELYDGQTSRNWPAVLRDNGNGEVQFSWAEGSSSYLLGAVTVSSRLGNTPRYINMPDGWKFESRDNDAIDALLAKHRLHGWQTLVHKLESRWHYVLASLLFVVAFVWAMLQYGLPAAAEVIAFHLPATVTDGVSKQTLASLDEHFFETSKLPDATQKRLKARFAQMTAPLNGLYRFELQFRKGGEVLGANAFALPSGTVVMTDELVELADNENQLVAVLAHELGHVVNRHGLRQILQHSVLTLFLAYATGDVSSVAVALPVMLVQLGYSRDFEREADDYAYDYLLNHQIATASFANILTRIEDSQQQRREKVESEGEDSSIFEYLSTHPDTAQRVKRFEGGR
jgi:Zn-dependent protease with chaperone function